MSNKAQFYLIASAKIPSNLWLFDEDLDCKKEFRGQINENFGQVLTPLGEDLTDQKISAPEGTKFAGILWGDGEHFEEDRENTWGILGEISRISDEDCCVYDVDGEVILTVERLGADECLPHVMPPEAFGLKRHAWWKDEFLWC